MKNNYPKQNETPAFIKERDVLGQIKPSGINVLKKIKHRINNAPNLKVVYASFGIRAIATLSDLIIVMGALLILEAVFFKFNFNNYDYNTYRFFIVIFLWLFYNGILESSAFQATLGKMIMKLKVIDLYGKRLNFTTSLLRCITTIISISPFGLGIWYMTTDPKKCTWHDLIAGTFVIKL